MYMGKILDRGHLNAFHQNKLFFLTRQFQPPLYELLTTLE